MNPSPSTDFPTLAVLLADALPVQLAYVDAQQRYRFVNKRYEDWFSCSASEILGRTVAEVMSISVYQEAENAITVALSGENVFYELAVTTRTGEKLNFRVNYIPHFCGEQEVLGFFILAQDITESKQTHKALQQSETRLCLALSAARMGFWEWNIQTGKIIGSPNLEQLYGWPNEVYNSTYEVFITIVHPEDRKAFEQANSRALLAGENCDVQFRVLCPDGSERWIESKGQVIYDATGKPERMTGIDLDVTERKLAESALHELTQQLDQRVEERTQSLERTHVQLVAEIAQCAEVEAKLRQREREFRALAENAPDIIVRFDCQRRHLYVNPAVEQATGISASEFIGKTNQELDLPESCLPLWEHALNRVFDTGREEEVEFSFSALDEERYYQSRLVPEFTTDGLIKSVLAICRDITERKQVEIDMQRALEKEKELSELRSSFLSLVSHEFRTPLTTILSSNQMLERYGEQLSTEKKLTHHKRVQSAVEQMTQLLDEVLLVGKAEAGKLKFDPSPMDIVTFCSNVVEMFQGSATLHTINFTSKGKGSGVELDEKLLGHILTNLLSNAVKYSPKGTTIQFDLICNPLQVKFCIQDNGIGIPEADLPQLFESFRRASNVGAIRGTGLGLAIVKQAVDLHGGSIAVESKVGIGTIFTVELPLKSQFSIAAD